MLWVHEVSYSEKPVYEYQDFAERLVSRGHNVEVIDFNESVSSTNERYSVSRTGSGEVTLCTIPHSNIPVLKYIEARERYKQMLRSRLEEGKIDVAFVYSVFINGSSTVKLCHKFGIPVVYRVLDAYHRLRPGKMIQEILRYGERYVYRNADSILVTNEKMINYVSEIANRDVSNKVVVVNHGVDIEHFVNQQFDIQLAEKYQIKSDDIVALFLGTTYTFSGLYGLLKQMPQILKVIPSFKLMIVGSGELDDELAILVQNSNLSENVVMTGMIPYTELPKHLSLAKIAINPFQINPITQDIIPIKILQYQAAGLPVLSTPLPDLVIKHPEKTSGVIYSISDSTEDFIIKMVELLLQPSILYEKGVKGQQFVKTNYSIGIAVDNIEKICSTQQIASTSDSK